MNRPLKLLSIPLAYYLMAQKVEKIWIQNPLRQYFKIVFHPYEGRYDDSICSDKRDFVSEMKLIFGEERICEAGAESTKRDWMSRSNIK